MQIDPVPVGIGELNRDLAVSLVGYRVKKSLECLDRSIEMHPGHAEVEVAVFAGLFTGKGVYTPATVHPDVESRAVEDSKQLQYPAGGHLRAHPTTLDRLFTIEGVIGV